MLKQIKTILFENIVTIVNEVFTKVIQRESEFEFYEKQNQAFLLAKIRVGHIFTSFVFIFFGVVDYFIIDDKQLFTFITIVRLAIFFFVLTPFLLVTFLSQVKLFIRPAIFITYMVFGGYIVFLSYVLGGNQISFFHNYLALNCLIMALFVILTYRVSDTFMMVFLLVLAYNIINYIHVSSDVFYIQESFSLKHFLNVNVWFVTITFISYVIWRLNENASQKHFLVQNKLNMQKKELQQTNQIKNKFFKIITHDLKNLIGPQYSLSNYLAEKHLDLSVDKRDEMIKMLESSAQNLLNLFEELVTWVKAQTSSIVIEPNYLKLNMIISDIHNLLKTSLADKNIILEIEIDKNIMVFCDENSIKMALRNVIGNAIKFSEEKSKIKILAEEIENEIVIVVIDNGVGMPPEQLELLFELDRGVTQVGTNGEVGTGLGLILTDELLKLNKGRIWVESEVGKGTVVSIALQQNSF